MVYRLFKVGIIDHVNLSFSFDYPSIRLFIHQSTHPSTHPSILPPIHSPTHPFTHPFTHQPVHTSSYPNIHPYMYPSTHCTHPFFDPSTYLPNHPFFYPFIAPSIHLLLVTGFPSFLSISPCFRTASFKVVPGAHLLLQPTKWTPVSCRGLNLINSRSCLNA